MNPIYEQMTKEEKDVHEAVRKFVDAADAFHKLNAAQKQKFYQEVCILGVVNELISGVNYGINKG